MNRDRIRNGFEFEDRVAKNLNGELVSGSGNKWYNKSDVRANGLIISCKATAKRTWKETRNQLNEAIDLSMGSGSIPALAVEDEDGAELIIFRLSDFAKVQAEGSLPVPPSVNSKGQEKRQRAEIPVLLRD